MRIRICILSLLFPLWLLAQGTTGVLMTERPKSQKAAKSPAQVRHPIPGNLRNRYPYKQSRIHSDHVPLRYRMTLTGGWLNRDDKIVGTSTMKGLTMDVPVVLGGTFGIEFLPTSSKESLRQWNNASIGIGLNVLNLGQQRYLGQAISPHAYVNVPFVRNQKLRFGIRPGIGIGYVTKTYANTVPEQYKWEAYKINNQLIANISVGSKLNAFITAGMYFDFPLDKGWAVTFDMAWQHLSNGSVMTPNAGYNMFNGEVGFTYTPGESTRGFHYYEPTPKVPKSLYDGVDKRWAVEVLAGGGCRSVYYRDQQFFGIASLTAAAYWVPVSIFRIGAGIDGYYDGAYQSVSKEFATEETTAPITYFGKTYLKESKLSNCFRMGISLQPEFILGHFTLGYHMGIYLIDPIKNLEPYAEAKKGLDRGIIYSYNPMKASTYQDGWFYQKLQLKYLCSEHVLVHIGLKLHIMKAEFIDAGIGVRI